MYKLNAKLVSIDIVICLIYFGIIFTPSIIDPLFQWVTTNIPNVILTICFAIITIPVWPTFGVGILFWGLTGSMTNDWKHTVFDIVCLINVSICSYFIIYYIVNNRLKLFYDKEIIKQCDLS